MSEEVQQITELQEHEILELEAQFPALSGRAFSAASRRSREAGQVVMQAEGDKVFQVFPDGHREQAMTIHPPHPVTVGAKIRIQ